MSPAVDDDQLSDPNAFTFMKTFPTAVAVHMVLPTLLTAKELIANKTEDPLAGKLLREFVIHSGHGLTQAALVSMIGQFRTKLRDWIVTDAITGASLTALQKTVLYDWTDEEFESNLSDLTVSTLTSLLIGLAKGSLSYEIVRSQKPDGVKSLPPPPISRTKRVRNLVLV